MPEASELTLPVFKKIITRNFLQKSEIRLLMNRLDYDAWEYLRLHFATVDKELIIGLFCDEFGKEGH